jgi:tetratricopeptide (TPR) repeat protein
MAKRSKKGKLAPKAVPSKAIEFGFLKATSTGDSDWLWGLVLVLAVVLTYWPVWFAGFFWDDSIHVTANPCVVGPLGLKEIWTTSLWRPFPLTITMFWIEHAFWGLAPLPYHLVNVFEHAACAVVLWRVLHMLQIPGAWLGAALWALHPLQVESVAWITEMKNTQSCLFYLLTVLFFLRWLKTTENSMPGDWNYFFTLLFAALAMASKSSTAVLPVVLILSAWWVEGRWPWRHLARLAPLFLLSAVASALTLWPGSMEITALSNPSLPQSWPQRVVTTGYVVWFYLGKLIWPHPLIILYPRWEIDAGRAVSYLPLLAVVIVGFVLWRNRSSWSRPWFFAFAYFLVALSPFLGLINMDFWRYSFVEDHLQNLAGMGPLALAGAGLVKFADWMLPNKRWLQSTLGAGLLLALAFAGWERTWDYESDERLWRDTLAKNPNCAWAYNHLAFDLLQRGQPDAAIVEGQKGLKINPNSADTHNTLGAALFQKGELDAATAEYQKALEIDPNFAEAHYNLGNALIQKQQATEAIAEYQKALAINPNYFEAHYNLGVAFSQKKQLDEAIVEFQKALKINPNHAEGRNNLGIALFQKGRVDEAIIEFQKAVQLNPDYTDAENNLAKVQAMAAQKTGQK